uniref:Uncharacterized protein n=1 Tax=Gopherus evgoodei TaxID=1825980 RepID=A0A8C5F2X0_9SAUR
RHCPGAQSRTHLEVLRIHMQLLAVQLAQLRKGLLDVIQVLHGVPKRSQHLLTMGKDLGVTQGFTTAFLHIDLGPQAGNIMLLVRCPVHHGGESGSARHVSWVRNQ